MPPFRNGRNGGSGGPQLPASMRDQLGIPSKPSRGGYNKQRQVGGRPHSNKPGRPPRRRADAGAEHAAESPRRSAPIAKPSSVKQPPQTPAIEHSQSSKKRKLDDQNTATSSSSRKKISAETSTPLSRLLASSSSSRTDDHDHDQPGSSRQNDTGSAMKKKKKKKTSTSETPLDPSIMRRGTRSKQEQDEDDEIAWLEWKLGAGKKGKSSGKGKGKAPVEDDEDDGLDDLLNFADSIVPDGAGESDDVGEDEDEEDDDDEEQIAGSGEEEDDIEQSDDEDLMGSEDDDLAQFWTDDSDAEDTDDVPPLPPAPATSSMLKPFKSKGDGELRAVRFVENNDDDASTDAASKSVVVDPTAASTGRYVPPHLRNKALGGATVDQASKSQERIQLERKLQGLLNKLSEANIEAIFGDIEMVYRSNSRNDCTTTITDLIINTISDKANLLDSFVVLYAALCATLYKMVGMEFGAHLVQTLIAKYTSLASVAMSPDAADNDDAGKQPLNLLVLISELYNFQVISCRIIYDIVRELIDALATQGPAGEFAVEALLKIVRSCGPQLRSDDPTSLKEIVLLVQQKTAGLESSMNARTKFMIETLVNLKNSSKTRSLPGAEAGAEATRRMKKYLGGLGKKRTILVHEPLRVSLADLRSADTRGKWWLVGAAWGGDPLAERVQMQKEVSQVKSSSAKTSSQDDDLGMLGANDVDALMKLARKQGMNTDVRRNVFVIMMSSEDYRHACQRLSQLKYTDVQQREFVRVALHCLGVEPVYNPYYALILCSLCTDSYSHRFTLQYAVWDMLRDMGQLEVGGAAVAGNTPASFDGEIGKVSKTRAQNVAKALAWTVAKGGADLSIFKAVDFVNLEPRTKTFFRTFFPHLLIALHTNSPIFKLPKQFERDEEKVEEVFSKTLGHSSLAQGLAFFVRRDMSNKVLPELGNRELALVEECLAVARETLSRAV